MWDAAHLEEMASDVTGRSSSAGPLTYPALLWWRSWRLLDTIPIPKYQRNPGQTLLTSSTLLSPELSDWTKSGTFVIVLDVNLTALNFFAWNWQTENWFHAKRLPSASITASTRRWRQEMTWKSLRSFTSVWGYTSVAHRPKRLLQHLFCVCLSLRLSVCVPPSV